VLCWERRRLLFSCHRPAAMARPTPIQLSPPSRLKPAPTPSRAHRRPRTGRCQPQSRSLPEPPVTARPPWPPGAPSPRSPPSYQRPNPIRPSPPSYPRNLTSPSLSRGQQSTPHLHQNPLSERSSDQDTTANVCASEAHTHRLPASASGSSRSAIRQNAGAVGQRRRQRDREGDRRLRAKRQIPTGLEHNVHTPVSVFPDGSVPPPSTAILSCHCTPVVLPPTVNSDPPSCTWNSAMPWLPLS
jgi:hypothetical protein